MSAFRHLRAILALPFMVTVVVPAVLLLPNGDARPGGSLSSPINIFAVIAGAALIVIGLGLAARTVQLFATVGEGALAPWDATQRLVVRGPYRYVRNPMITGVLAILLGEASLFGSLALLIWSGVFFLVNAIYMPLVEEPGLEQRFGEDYRRYKANVPRWLPRLTPWELK